MAKYKFSVKYTGDSVDDGRIPIRDLAPSLLALSEAFQVAQEISNPASESISLDIQATEKGSFSVDLILANGKDLIMHAVDLLTGKETDALLNLVGYVGLVGSAMGYLKFKGNKKVKETEELDEDKTKITLDDNTSLTIPNDALKIVKNVDFRKSTKDFVRPLNEAGIRGIELISETETELNMTIMNSEKDYFDVPDVKEVELNTTISVSYLQIINIAFENGKWKFSNGDYQFFAKIKDREFIDKVENNEIRFGSTDALKVRLETLQKIQKNGVLKSEFVVLEVLEHLKGASQMELDI